MPITISLDPGRQDLDAIHGILATTYWSPNIRREVVAEALRNSITAVAIDDATGATIGLARVVTDRATFAWLILGNLGVAAGLLIQRLPVEGDGNLAGQVDSLAREAMLGRSEDYRRISILTQTLKREELLTLDVETILRRLFWEEPIVMFEPHAGETAPKFACRCSRERVSQMIRSLGVEEADSIIAEQGQIEVACEFCGQQYRYDPIDAAGIFTGLSTDVSGGAVH